MTPIRKQLLNAPTTPSIVDVLSALIAEKTHLSSQSQSQSPTIPEHHSVPVASQRYNVLAKVHLLNHVSIVERPIILHTTVSLSIQRN